MKASYSVSFGTGGTVIHDADYATVAGGYGNTIGVTGLYNKHDGDVVYDTSYATIAGGYNNEIVKGEFDTVGGGVDNYVYGYSSTIRGGSGNRVHGDYGYVLTGNNCTVGGMIKRGEWSQDDGMSSYGVVMGGQRNTAAGNVPGKPNILGDGASFGVCDTCYGEGYAPTVVSGIGHEVSTGKYMSSVLGGFYNSARGNYATGVGGARNKAFSNFATILGGYKNKANGRFSTILGGSSNTINGRYSVALGYQARITADYSAVISLGSIACELNTDNTLSICANDVTFNGNSVVDEMSRRRRMLKEQQETVARVKELTEANAELKKTMDANRAALLEQDKLLAALDSVMDTQVTARAAAEKRLDAIRRLAVSNLGPDIDADGPPSNPSIDEPSDDSAPVQVGNHPSAAPEINGPGNGGEDGEQVHTAADDPGGDQMADDGDGGDDFHPSS